MHICKIIPIVWQKENTRCVCMAGKKKGAALLCVLVCNPPWKGPTPPGKCSWSVAASVFWSIIWLRESSAVLRMSFQMVIKLLLVIPCVCAVRCCEFSNRPTLGIISSPSWAKDKEGGRLISEEFHKYCGCSRWGVSQSNLNRLILCVSSSQCRDSGKLSCIFLLTVLQFVVKSCLKLKMFILPPPPPKKKMYLCLLW